MPYVGSATGPEQSRLERAVAEARESNGIPALGTLVLEDGEIRALAVAGRRSLAVEQAATPEDLWELASNGKAMTATLLARLVEREKVAFDSKLEAVFPDLAEAMHPAFREVTIRMLLNHSAGLPFDLFETEEEYYEEWVLASWKKKRDIPLYTTTKANARLLSWTGLDRFTPHDLRRTAATHMTSMGIHRLTVAKILNHAERGVTATYDRASYDIDKRRALTRWADRLEQIVDEHAGSEAAEFG
ncbi:MAG: serine hydrolase [Thermoanaerobaculia bacterium]